MGMITMDDRELKRFERDLKGFAHRAYPFATKQTINRAAFATQREARQRISADMVTRNRFTVQSVRVKQAQGLNVSRQEAVTGSTAAYMADQEFGGVKRKRGSQGVAIPTAYSAGQGEGAKPRTRLPRKPNKLQNIQLRNRTRKGSRRQRNAAAVRQAAQGGSKYVYMDTGRTRGIFRVVGGRKHPRVKMVHDLSRDSVKIPKSPWLAPSVAMVQPRIAGFYRDALRFQLQRAGLFK